MPWIRAKLRGKDVLAKAREDGKWDEQQGRVEVRYKPSDGRLYRAAAANLQIADPQLLPDDTCGPAEPVGPASKAAGARKRPTQAKDQPEAETQPSGEGWEAWTDGACSGNPGPAGLGMILLHAGERSELSEYLGLATNNIAELTAILRALERVPDSAQLVVHTDSQYSIGVLQKHWKPKANRELIEGIKERLARRPRTRLIYTAGHAGIALNEAADRLAREAVQARATRESATKRPK